MASTKHYVVLAMIKPGVAAASEGMPCLLKRWLSGPAQYTSCISLVPRIPYSRASSHGIAVATSGKMRM